MVQYREGISCKDSIPDSLYLYGPQCYISLQCEVQLWVPVSISGFLKLRVSFPVRGIISAPNLTIGNKLYYWPFIKLKKVSSYKNIKVVVGLLIWDGEEYIVTGVDATCTIILLITELLVVRWQLLNIITAMHGRLVACRKRRRSFK